MILLFLESRTLVGSGGCLRGGVRRVSTSHIDCTLEDGWPGRAIAEFATTSPSLYCLGAHSERDCLLGACASGSLKVMALPRPVPSDWWGLSSLPFPAPFPPIWPGPVFLSNPTHQSYQENFTLQHPGKTCSTNSTDIFSRLNLTLSLRQNMHKKDNSI